MTVSAAANGSAFFGPPDLFLEHRDRQFMKRREAVRLGPEPNGSRSPNGLIVGIDQRPAVE
jgi:hypothetical protein